MQSLNSEYLFYVLFDHSLLYAIFNSSRSSAIFLVTLSTSILIYRLGFHRLNRFPGPRTLIASKWAMIPVDLKGNRPHLLQKLHLKHGNIVRFGPRELSINDPEELPSIYGANAKNNKGPLYSFMTEAGQDRSPNVFTALTMAEHSRLRKNWDSGFSISALQRYEECLRRNVESAISQVSKLGKDQSNVAVDEITSWFAFDFMSEVGFNRSFGNLREGKTVPIVKRMQETSVMTLSLGNVPYLADLFRQLPSPLVARSNWIAGAITKCLETLPLSGDDQTDIISRIIKRNRELDNTILSFKDLHSEAELLVAGGADTSSNAISLALFHLINEPAAYRRVQEEMDQCFAGSVAGDLNKLTKECPYLNAVLSETLRLWPPVASGLQRLTPLEGLALKSGIHIPGDVIVSTPTFVFHRDPRNFSHPNEFRPERWMDSSKETVHNSKAFTPFGFGPTNCVGKQLGLMMVRLFVARFVQAFDASFAPGFDANLFMASIKDHFVIAKDSCLIVVNQRSSDIELVDV